MAALLYGFTASSVAQLFYTGRSSPPWTSLSQRCASFPTGSPLLNDASYSAGLSNPGRSLRLGRIEQNAGTIVRISDLETNFLKENSSTVASAYRRDGPLYLLSDYDGEGPIELPPKETEIDPFAIPEASPVQITASIFLTGAIGLLLVRSIRRRAARSKDMQFRSSGVSTSKSIKEEARKALVNNLTKAPDVPVPPPSPAQTAFGAIVAGIIAVGLYKFTSTVEASFSNKAVSQDYSIRNLTITVRTIITGLCYLATFVFAANSIGLTLYAFQLLLGFGVPDPSPPSDSGKKDETKSEEKPETDDSSEE